MLRRGKEKPGKHLVLPGAAEGNSGLAKYPQRSGGVLIDTAPPRDTCKLALPRDGGGVPTTCSAVEKQHYV